MTEQENRDSRALRGRDYAGAGAHSRGGGSLRGHGARTRCRPTYAPRAASARMSDPKMIKGNPACSEHPGHGEVPHRPHRRGAHTRSARHRLHRRERGPLPRRRPLPIDKRQFRVPFVCGARNLSEALRRVEEGAAMIRTKGEPGTRRRRAGGAPHARRARGDCARALTLAGTTRFSSWRRRCRFRRRASSNCVSSAGFP